MRVDQWTRVKVAPWYRLWKMAHPLAIKGALMVFIRFAYRGYRITDSASIALAVWSLLPEDYGIVPGGRIRAWHKLINERY